MKAHTKNIVLISLIVIFVLGLGWFDLQLKARCTDLLPNTFFSVSYKQCIMQEDLKDLCDYEGLYKISETSLIYSEYSGMFLKHIMQKTGYKTVTLYKNKIPKIKTIHRLVAENYIPNPNNYRCVNHKDGNKSNNSKSNLEWCTHSYNSKHSFDVLNRIIWNKGKKSKALSESKKSYKNPMAREIINIYSGFVYNTIIEAAKAKNIPSGTLYSRMVRDSKLNEFYLL